MFLLDSFFDISTIKLRLYSALRTSLCMIMPVSDCNSLLAIIFGIIATRDALCCRNFNTSGIPCHNNTILVEDTICDCLKSHLNSLCITVIGSEFDIIEGKNVLFFGLIVHEKLLKVTKCDIIQVQRLLYQVTWCNKIAQVINLLSVWLHFHNVLVRSHTRLFVLLDWTSFSLLNIYGFLCR